MPTRQTHYEIHGRSYLRVTTLLERMFKDPEYADGIRDPKAYREATTLGSQADRLIQQDLRGEPLQWPRLVSLDLKQVWEAYSEWRRLAHPHPHGAVQQLVYSDQHGLAGTPDFEEPWRTTDFKATARILRRHWLQVNTYVRLRYPQDAPKVVRRIVRLDKMTGMSEQQEQLYSEDDWQIVLALKQAHDLLYPTGGNHARDAGVLPAAAPCDSTVQSPLWAEGDPTSG